MDQKKSNHVFSRAPYFITLAIVIILALGAIVTMTACSETESGSSGLCLASNGKSEYTVVYPFTDNMDKDDEYFRAARTLVNSLTTNTEAIIPLLDEEEAGKSSENAKEVIIGNTSRYEYTQEELDKIGDLGYMIKTVGNKILIMGSDARTTTAAVNHLITFYMDKEAKEMTVPDGLFTINYIEPIVEPETPPAAEFLYGPTVFVVEDEYQIIYHTNLEGLAWVEIDGVKYYDEYAGIIKSETPHHNIAVPMEVLDKAKSYTINFAPVYQRKPYSPTAGRTVSETYNFRPVDTSDGVQIYTIADPHSVTDLCSNAAKYYGDKLDLLVLCGDILSESTSLQKMYDIAIIAKNVTNGEIPVVYARGNHEIRGEASEFIDDYIGTANGNPYFTFRLGNIWGVVLDCGEDKADSHVEYGGMIAFDNFRNQQTEFLKEIVANADSEYNAEGVEYRIAVCHVPFPIKEDYPPSPDIFREWTALCSQMDLDIMITGHHHSIAIKEPGLITPQQNFYVVVTSRSNRQVGEGEDAYMMYTGTAIDITEETVTVTFTDDKLNVVEGGKTWDR